MNGIILQACKDYADHLRGLSQKHEDERVRRVATSLLQAYDQVLTGSPLTPNTVPLTAAEVRDVFGDGEGRKLLRAFVSQTFLGLFSSDRPRVLYLGPETAADPEVRPGKTKKGPRTKDRLVNFALEVLYLPLLRQSAARGDVVAAIAGPEAPKYWSTCQIVFADNPSAYYEPVHHSHTWAAIVHIQREARDGTLVNCHVNERSCQPAHTTRAAAAAGRVSNGVLTNIVTTLRPHARVLVIHGGHFGPQERQLVADFLHCSENDVKLRVVLEAPRVQTMDLTDPADGIQRWVFVCPQLSRRGIPSNAGRDEVGRIIRQVLHPA